MMKTQIRPATYDDLAAIIEIESCNFPEGVATKPESYEDKLKNQPDHYLVMEEQGQVVGFIEGFANAGKWVEDYMFEGSDQFDPEGEWEKLLTLAILPDYQSKGYGKQLMRAMIQVVKDRQQRGLSLTCLEHLVPYYEHLGFSLGQLSESKLGGLDWYDMYIEFD